MTVCSTTRIAMAKLRATDALVWLEELAAMQKRDAEAWPEKAEVVVSPGRRVVYRLQGTAYVLGTVPEWASKFATQLRRDQMVIIMRDYVKLAPV